MKIYRNIDARELKIDERELAARLGVPYGSSAEELSALSGELIAASKPAYVATRVKLERKDGRIKIGGVSSQSAALAKLCKDSSECIAIVATLGIGVDRLILKMAERSASGAFFIDALADALVEALCDLAEREVSEGLKTSGRFSPGYADIELGIGREIIALSGADKLLGIRFTESGLMVPKKSVNALIAIR